MNYKPILLGIITSLLLGVAFILILGSSKNKTPDIQSGVLSSTMEDEKGNSEYEIEDFSSLKKLIKEKSGIYGLHIWNLKSGEKLEINSNQSFYGASLYKILVGGAVYDLINEDELSLNYLYTYNSEDYASGTGLIKNYEIGTSYSVDELLDYLFKNSDNVAQNILERNIPRSSIDTFYLDYTKLTSENEVNKSTGTFAANLYTNPAEVTRIFYNIYKFEKWSRSTKREFFERMMDTQFEDRIAKNLSKELVYSHKIANAPQYTSWHDCGVVFTSDFTDPTFVCLMSKNTTYEEFLDVSYALGELLNTFY